MKISLNRRTSRIAFLAAAALCAGTAGVSACASDALQTSATKSTAAPLARANAASAPAQPLVAAPIAPAAGPAMRSGYVAFVDPVTGSMTPPSATVTVPVDPNNSSVAGLVPVHQNSGAIVDLQGRFRSQMVAVIEPDGTLDVHCSGDDHGKAGAHAK